MNTLLAITRVDVADYVSAVFLVYFILIFIRILLSWVPRMPYYPWLRATVDQVVSDRSMFDLATLGELGVVPGWPGADVMPPQPMETQLRAVLQRYAGNGGRWREVELDGVAHGIPLEVPDVVAAEIARTMADA